MSAHESSHDPRGRVSTRQFLQIFTAVMLPMFLAAVDQTLLSTATPAIAAELGGLRDSFWIMTGYLITSSVISPLYGRLGDRYGRREILLGALVVFMTGALLAGFAASMSTLVAARVVQALGGGGLMVMSQALIGELVAPRERVRYQAYFASMFALSNLSGPVLGGLIVSSAGWRWLFWSVIPLAGIALWRVAGLPARSHRGSVEVFRDLPGIALFAAAGVVSLLWLSLAGHRFAWESVASLSLVAGATALWMLLTWQERRVAAPFLPVELLRIRGIPMAAVTVLFSSACLFSMTVFLPVYMQLGLKFDAAHAGLALLPLTCAMPIGGMSAGRIVARTGQLQGLTAVGMTVAAVAFLALGIAPPTLESVLVLGFFCGVGLGTVMPMTQVTVQTLAGRERLGVAAALVSLARTTGGALGTAATGALLFAFMHGVDLRSLADIADADRPGIIEAFRHTFLALGVLAALGAGIASRVPALKL